MKKNETLKKRIEKLAEKTNTQLNADIVVDAIKTVCTKNVADAKFFLTESVKITDVNEYEKLKDTMIIRKKREISQKQKQKSFDKQLAKLKEKYGIGE